jgi:putative copper resistance protein D
VISLLLVWLRAIGLIGQAMALGGVVFTLVVLGAGRAPQPPHRLRTALAIAAVGGLLAASAQAIVLTLIALAFADQDGWPIREVLGSTVGTVGLARVIVALLVAGAALGLRRALDSRAWAVLLLAAGASLPVLSAFVSHAVGREHADWLIALGTLHQAAAGVWVGGLVCAAALALRREADATVGWLRPFSWLAAAAVAAIAVTGVGLAVEYVATPGAAIGTSYGAMVLTKIVLFVALVVMGALNHRAVRGRWAASPAHALVVRRRVEVEAGLALVAVFMAASIASAPPGADAGVPRATPEEIGHLFAPHWPRLESPTLAEMAATPGLGDPNAPRTPEQTAWSEFGHNVAGLFVVAMGVLATLERTGRVPWARHWPLLITALAGFVAFSLDPEGWQTGKVGFWEQLLSAEVLQHRLLLVLTALFGVAEWQIRSGRRPQSRWRFLFPLIAVVSGVLLLSHVHETSSVKSAFLMELTHLPLGLISLLVGWSRWLELRLPPAEGGGPGRVWGPALTLFGLILVFYREV